MDLNFSNDCTLPWRAKDRIAEIRPLVPDVSERLMEVVVSTVATVTQVNWNRVVHLYN